MASTHNFLPLNMTKIYKLQHGILATLMKNKNKYSPELPAGEVVYATKCPVLYALEVIGGKWKLPVLWHLSAQGTVRYNQLKRSVYGITGMMLTKCLKELEEDGLVLRVQYQEIPPKVEYSLTERGKKLLPALKKLYAWGEEQLFYKESLSGVVSD